MASPGAKRARVSTWRRCRRLRGSRGPATARDPGAASRRVFSVSSSRDACGWRSCRHCQVVSSVPVPSVSMAPPSSAKSIGVRLASRNKPLASRRSMRRSSSSASNFPPQPVKRKSSRRKTAPHPPGTFFPAGAGRRRIDKSDRSRIAQPGVVVGHGGEAHALHVHAVRAQAHLCVGFDIVVGHADHHVLESRDRGDQRDEPRPRPVRPSRRRRAAAIRTADWDSHPRERSAAGIMIGGLGPVSLALAWMATASITLSCSK